jgi:DNA primase
MSLERAVTTFQQELGPAVPYLRDRGMTREIAAKYRLGYVPEDYSGECELYRGRICIPYLTRGGVVAVRFRQAGGGSGPKYLSTPGDVPRLFNVASLFEPGGVLVVCEGEFDSIIVREFAAVPSVGCPGVSLWSSVFSRMVADYPERVIVGDGDEAGRAFATDLAKELDGRAVVMPAGYDCNSFYLERGADGLRDFLGL